MVTMPAADTDLVKGYEMRELLGEGGFGAVYRAYQPSVGREVAIKIILPAFANRPDFVRKFETEAQIIARLEHFHIVPLYDYWREPSGAYFVMRLLRGGTLREMLKKGPLSIEMVMRLTSQIAAALSIAHRNGVVHRDLKPDNILLDVDGNAYLADFGIAKLLKDDELAADDADLMVGSPAYASPEQIRSEGVTAFSDQYSFGIMLFEMLSGQHPYSESAAAAMLARHLQEPMPWVRKYRETLPTDVDLILARATAKMPEQRYPNVQMLAQELLAVLSEVDTDITTLGVGSQRSVTTPYDTPTTYQKTVNLTMDWAEVTNPYKGLRAFQEADGADFFGRTALIDQLLERLNGDNRRFLALVGPSGSGKSSVVKAGVIPAIRQGRLPQSDSWFVVEMFPGAYPLEELEAALMRVAVRPVDGLIETLQSHDDGLIRAVQRMLPNDGSELVLYIDQFEEVFTFVESDDERMQLFKLIETATQRSDSRVRVIVTLRGDFYDRPLMFPSFGDMFRRHTEVILPMTTEELEAAVVGPAQRIGMQLEPSLTKAIVSDVQDQPGSLPLLQYALTELFERRDGPVLTMAAYTDIGGAMGALARRADDLFVQLNDKQRVTTRQLFLRLVNLGEGTEDTRRRVLRSELISLAGEDQEAMDSAITLFSRYRLLTLDRDANTREPTIDIAHESLIREWGRLRDWLNNSREGLRMQRRIMAAAEDWLSNASDPSYLARGGQLETMEAWANETDLSMTVLEQAYIQESIEGRAQREAEVAAQVEREKSLERRSRNVLRALLAVLNVALLVAIGLSVWAIRERNLARENAGIADRAAEISRSAGLAAQARLALFEGDTDLAVTLALEANRIDNPPPLAQNILFEIAYAPGTTHFLAAEVGEVQAVTVFQAPLQVVYGGRDGTVGVWSPLTEENVTVSTGESPAQTIARHPQRAEVLVGYADGSLVAYEIPSGQVVSRFGVTTLDGSNAVTAVMYGSDPSVAFVGLQNGAIIAFDLASGNELYSFGTDETRHSNSVTAMDLSADGSQLVTASVDRTVRLWNVSDGVLTAAFSDHGAPIRDVSFSLDELSLYSGAQNGEVVVRGLAGQGSVRLLNAGVSVWRLAPGPAGTLLTGGQDGVLRQWNIENWTQISAFEGHTNTILGVERIDTDGNVVTVSNDGTLRTWNFFNQQVDYLIEDTGSTRGGVFSMDVYQDKLVVGGAFGSLNLYNIETGQIDRAANERIVTFNTSFTKVAFVNDGTQILTGALDGSVNLWDISSGSTVGNFGRHRGAVQALAVHPGQAQVATASRDNTLRIWDVSTGAEIVRPVDGDLTITALAYAPDGDTLLAGTAGGLILFDASANYERVWEREEVFARDVVSIEFTADGARFAAGSLDETAAVFQSVDGAVLQRVVGHEDPVQAVAFASDGLKLLTASGNAFADDVDVSLRLWDVETGQQLRQFGDEHTENINAAVYIGDGVVISADGNSDIIRYNMLTLAELLMFTEANRYGRPLTCGEQALYGVDQGNCL